MHIIVTSKNPVKLNATKAAFTKLFPEEQLKFETLSVPSGVSDQPMTNSETRQGAINRTKAATEQPADYYVGIEGGVEHVDNNLEAFAWIAINNGQYISKAKTGTFVLPPPVRDLVKQGLELGDANDQFFKQHNSKQQGGAVGLLTNGVLGRTEYYEQALILALIPFINKELYLT